MAELASRRADYLQAEKLFTQSLALFRQAVAFYQAEPGQAVRHLEKSASLFNEMGDQTCLAISCRELGRAVLCQGPEAYTNCTKNLETVRLRLGDAFKPAWEEGSRLSIERVCALLG